MNHPLLPKCIFGSYAIHLQMHKCSHEDDYTHTHLWKDHQLGERRSSSFAQNQTFFALSECGWLYQLAFVRSSCFGWVLTFVFVCLYVTAFSGGARCGIA